MQLELRAGGGDSVHRAEGCSQQEVYPLVTSRRGAGRSVRWTGVAGGPEQVWYHPSVQLEDGAHTEQVHDLV